MSSIDLAAILLFALSHGLPVTAQEGNTRVAFHDGKLSLTIAKNDSASSMDDVLTGTVTNFEEAFEVKKKGEFRFGKIQGPSKKWSAAFTTLELEMVGKPQNIPFRFYLTIFDTGTAPYLI